jgi:hypothetical protein
MEQQSVPPARHPATEATALGPATALSAGAALPRGTAEPAGPALTQASPSRTETVTRVVVTIVVVVGIVVGIALRAWFLFHRPIISDVAVAGLIAHQILHGHTYAYFWGQPFGGVEPYVVAAVFALFGQSSLTLGLAPALLSGVSAVLVWRVARRLVASPSLAVLAGVLAWVSPLPAVLDSTVEGGYRGATLVCGLVVVLACLRIMDGNFGIREFVLLGLAAGVGWWALPEIVYFLIPGAVILVGAIVRSPPAHDLRQWLARAGVAVVAFCIGALPWLWTNLSSGFASLNSSDFPGSNTPLNPGLGGRLRIAFKDSIPLQLNLRRLSTGNWLFGAHGTSSLERAGLLVVVAVVIIVVVVALVLCLLSGWRGIAVASALVLFPFLVALQPGTWYWQDGRYTVYFGALLALVLAKGCEQAVLRFSGRRGAHAAGPAGRPWTFARLFMSVLVIVAMAMTVADFHESFGVTASGFSAGWGNPDGGATATAEALEARGLRFGYADYWVAYKLDFLSHERLSIGVAGSDPDRWESLNQAVQKSGEAAWFFVPAGQMGVGTSQFAQTTEIQGPSGQPEAAFTAALDRLGIPYRTVDVGPLRAIIPAHPVVMDASGQVTRAPG